MPRPRIHPVGHEPTGADRAARSRVALALAGGSVRQFRLSPAATVALARLRARLALPTDTAVIEHLLTDAAR